MGLKSRRKGHGFERKIASEFRRVFPELRDEIKRSIQSRGAEGCDVAGIPGLWVECQHAEAPTPLEKLEQAERDVAKTGRDDTCVAITRKTRGPIRATVRVSSLLKMVLGGGQVPAELASVPVTMELEDFFRLMRRNNGA